MVLPVVRPQLVEKLPDSALVIYFSGFVTWVSGITNCLCGTPLFLALAIHLTTGSHSSMPTSKFFQPPSTHRTACTACVAATVATMNSTLCLLCSNASTQRHRTTSMSLQPQKSRASTSSTASRALADLGLRRRRSTTGKNIGAGIGRIPSTSGSGPGSVPIPAVPSTKGKEFGGTAKVSNVVCVILSTPLFLGFWLDHSDDDSGFFLFDRDGCENFASFVTGMSSSISILIHLFYFYFCYIVSHQDITDKVPYRASPSSEQINHLL